MFSNEKLTKYFFWRYFAQNETFTKFQIFDKNHGLTPLQKCQFCGFLKPIFLLFRKACLLYKTSKMFFSRFLFTIHDMGMQGVKRGYKGLQGVTEGYRGLRGVTVGYKGLPGVTGGYKWLQGMTRGDKASKRVQRIIEYFFLTRTFPDTFSWSILHKNQR